MTTSRFLMHPVNWRTAHSSKIVCRASLRHIDAQMIVGGSAMSQLRRANAIQELARYSGTLC